MILNVQRHTVDICKGPYATSNFHPEDDTKVKSLSVFAEPLRARLLPHVPDRPPVRGTAKWPWQHPLCGAFAWLQIRFSGICSVNDILGLCLTGGHIVRMCTCAAWSCGATAPSLYLPWACDSLIKYSYFPLKYMASTGNPQSAACPPAQMLFHVSDKNPQTSPSIPFAKSSLPLPSHLPKLGNAAAYLMFLLCPHSWPTLSTEGREADGDADHTAHWNDAFIYFAFALSMVARKTNEGFFHAFSPLPCLQHRGGISCI